MTHPRDPQRDRPYHCLHCLLLPSHSITLQQFLDRLSRVYALACIETFSIVIGISLVSNYLCRYLLLSFLSSFLLSFLLSYFLYFLRFSYISYSLLSLLFPSSLLPVFTLHPSSPSLFPSISPSMHISFLPSLASSLPSSFSRPAVDQWVQEVSG